MKSFARFKFLLIFSDVEQIPINQTVYQKFRGNSLAGKRLYNDVIDPDKVLKGFQWRSRPHVFSPKLCNATTLPLYFYLGYQILQEQNLMNRCGHVRFKFIFKKCSKKLIISIPHC